jgi:hypothetical protein
MLVDTVKQFNLIKTFVSQGFSVCKEEYRVSSLIDIVDVYYYLDLFNPDTHESTKLKVILSSAYDYQSTKFYFKDTGKLIGEFMFKKRTNKLEYFLLFI